MAIEELPKARIAYELRGRGGDPTVLIHGSWVDRRSWDLVVPGLAHSLDVLSYDRRGHGESTGAARIRPVEDDASDLASLLEARNHFPAHLIAHSYGAAVALRLAQERPELVRSHALHEPPFVGLLLDDPATGSEAEFLIAEARRAQALVRSGNSERAVHEALEVFTLEPGAWGRLPSAVRSGFVRHAERWVEELDDPAMLLPDPGPFRELLVPALLTYGAQSPGFLRRVTERLASAIPNARLQEIPESGHVPHLTGPDRYVGVLLTFLVERDVPVT